MIGATYPEMGRQLRAQMPDTVFLVPGYGAQGAGAAELAPYFDRDGLGVIVNSSRGIIAAWKKEAYAKYGEAHYAEAARAAVADMIQDLRSALR